MLVVIYRLTEVAPNAAQVLLEKLKKMRNYLFQILKVRTIGHKADRVVNLSFAQVHRFCLS